jgi:MFS family permease
MSDPGPERDPEPFSGIPRGQRREQAKKVGRAIGTGAKGTGRAVAATARVTGRFSRFTFHQARRAANAQGADRSGLSRLIEMHTFNTAGDAAVAISLAGSLFFQVPSGEARDQVALFLALTMLPFAIVAPLIGPFLDRFAHGRRWAIGATMALRAFLCWVLASSVESGNALVFAAALGVLVASKAYGVTRAAAVPRLLPRDFTLVKANGRVSLSGIVGATVSAPIAGLASLAGSEWSLRYAFVLFVIATVCAIRLPAKVDSSEGEGEMTLRKGTGRSSRRGRLRTQIPASVAFALRANCGPWFMSGFLLMFVAFLLRNPDVRPDSSLNAGVMIGIVVGAAGLGRVLGTLAASTLRKVTPAVAVVVALVADAAAALVAALFYGVWSLALLGLVAGLCQALAKFSLDATIQRHIPPTVQASAFGRSDTTCQLAWVLGGFIGIALPLDPPRLGLFVAFVVVTAWTGFVLTTVPKKRAPSREPDHSPDFETGHASPSKLGSASNPPQSGA